MHAVIELSTVTCPFCGHASSSEWMPHDACVFFYECKGCSARIGPLPGDCCVFCSYGSVPCHRFRPSGALAPLPTVKA
jgi:hypothetical protein